MTVNKERSPKSITTSRYYFMLTKHILHPKLFR